MKLKKKAVLSALAMLIVTAIALSSATFAWFTAGTVVSVETISASITNTDGSLLISADNITYDIVATAAEIAAYSGNTLPSGQATGGTFVPVSCTPASQQLIAGSINGETRLFSASGNATAGFFKVTIWLKATSDMTVTVDPTFAPGATPFLYAALITPDEAAPLILGTAGDSYFPIANGTVSCVDDNANDIIDALDAGYLPAMLGAQVTAVADGTMAISLAANVAETITILMWAEGQDAQCSGPITTATSSLTLSVTKD